MRVTAPSAAQVERLAAAFLRDQALFLDLEALVKTAFVRFDYGEQRASPEQLSEPQLRQCIVDTAADLLREEYARFLDGYQGGEVSDDRDEFLVAGLGVPRNRVHATAVRYNGLPLKSRRAFRALAIDRTLPEDLLGGAWETPEELREDMLIAMEVVLDRKRGES